jgi:hypothetical protein
MVDGEVQRDPSSEQSAVIQSGLRGWRERISLLKAPELTGDESVTFSCWSSWSMREDWMREAIRLIESSKLKRFVIKYSDLNPRRDRTSFKVALSP